MKLTNLKNRGLNKTSYSSQSVFSESYSSYYDLLYQNKDYQAETRYVIKLLAQFKSPGKNILELGSGTGKHASILSKSGFQVVGVERSPEMASLAELNNNFKLLIGDITQFKIKKKFHSALSLFHVVSYLTSNKSIQALFENVNIHLYKNGIFIFDVWYSPAVLFTQPEVRVKRMSNNEIEILRIAEPEILENLNQVNVNYTIFSTNKKTNIISEIHEKHAMRHFSIPEISYIANQNGFVVEHVEEFLTKKTPSQTTWGCCFVLRKINNLGVDREYLVG